MAKILLLGCGKMGQALLNGWLKSGVSKDNIIVIDPLAQFDGINIYADINDYHGDADYVIIAIKPQLADALLPRLERFKRAVFVSIMAGKTTHYLSSKLLSMQVVRAMPNLPATIGCGYTALFAPVQVNDKSRAEISQFFAACGEIVWLQDEAQMDAITALSGSGPAYIFLFADAMMQTGIELGLPADLAKKAALQTILGGAEFAIESSESLSQLQDSVASKGGTTEAALAVLKDGDALKTLLKNAMLAAYNRSKNLGD